jgi:GNAT superfamily N-acetyltransferase
MPDMLVKLYALPETDAELTHLRTHGVDVRRSIAPEKHLVVRWVREQFNETWASECEVAFAHVPIGCVIAVQENRLLGFACYDATAKGFFGPTGVASDARRQGIGKALLMAALQAMRAEGYGYAIIGAAGPTDYYAKAVGATPIEDSSPGVYRGMLRKRPANTPQDD